MKLKLSLLAALTLTSASSFAAVVNGGTVHFQGELVNAACAVATDSANQTVTLGQFRTASLAAVGEMTGVVPFSINLVDCDPAISQTASIAFTGQTSAANPDLLATSAGGGNAIAATNVGIQILDQTQSPLALDGNSWSPALTLITGTNTLNFSARYVATGTATPGAANADATFQIDYQ